MQLKAEQLTAIIDTREQKPLDLSPLQMRAGTLSTGDYSILGMEDLVVVERKELSDLVSCIGSNRDRFERELQRLRAYPVRCIVVEGKWTDLACGNYRSQLNPKSATHTIASWMSHFQIPIHFVDNHELASDFVSYFLFTSAKRLLQRMNRVLPLVATETHGSDQNANRTKTQKEA